VVRDPGGIDPQPSYFRDRRLIVLRIDSVRKQKLCLTLEGVDFDREGNGGTDEDALGALFGYYQTTFLDTELAAEASRDDDGPALA
jgi:hypothetical protein